MARVKNRKGITVNMPDAVLYFNKVKGGVSTKVVIYKGDNERWTAYQIVKQFPKLANSMSPAERVLGLEAIYKQRPSVHKLAKQSLENVDDVRAQYDRIEEADSQIAALEKEIAELRREKGLAQTWLEFKIQPFDEHMKALTSKVKAA